MFCETYYVVEDSRGRPVAARNGDPIEWTWPTPASGPIPCRWIVLHPWTDELITVYATAL